MIDLASQRRDPLAICNWCWQQLDLASRTPDHPFRLGVLATTSLSEKPSARNVVLREVAIAARELYAFADGRSLKLVEIQQQPHVVWVGYDPLERVQLRINAYATIHTSDAVANDYWLKLPLIHRRQYLAPVAPGTEFTEPFINRTERAGSDDLTLQESEAGRGHFAVIRITVEQIDWYYLHPEGHLRLRLDWSTSKLQWMWLAS
ncbi:hypothetical protein GC163_14460 [bacterium]|nr:hypothetical protein [bacterium]